MPQNLKHLDHKSYIKEAMLAEYIQRVSWSVINLKNSVNFELLQLLEKTDICKHSL